MSVFDTEEQAINETVVVEDEQQELPRRISFLNGGVKSLGKGQDFVAYGTEEEFDWGVLLDGHGGDKFINLMRPYDWRAIMTSEDPWEKLSTILHTYPFCYCVNSGSTLLMMRAYADRLETLSVGDSGLVIYKNGILVYKSTEHNSENANEVERLNSRKVKIEKMDRPIPCIASAKNLRTKLKDYITFEDGTRIAPTQALGHCNITKYAPEVHIETFKVDDEMRCVLFSDGFGDMFLFDSDVEEDKLQDERDILTMTAAELIEKVEARWRQVWRFYYDASNPDVFYEDKFPLNGMDDVGVLVWDNKKMV
jgi:serine/threonine protein phosphatase PrpC